MPPRKTEIVVALVAQQKWREALRIASGFKFGLTKEQRATLKRAHESYSFGAFQRQLGQDPEELQSAGIVLLRRLWG